MKTNEIKPLIENYTTIRWQPNLKVYGKYKKWTSKDTFFTQGTNKWFTPNGNERRVITRQNRFQVADFLSLANHQAAVFMDGTIIAWADGLMADYTNFSNNKTIAPPVFALRMKDDKEDNFFYNGKGLFWNMGVANYDLEVQPHNLLAVGSTPAAWNMFNMVMRFTNPDTAITFLSPGVGEIMRYQFYPMQGYNSWQYISYVRSQYSYFPQIFNGTNAAARSDEWDNAWKVWANCTEGSSWKTETPNADFDAYVARGVTWHLLDDASIDAQAESLYYMMLGRDNSQKFNIYKCITDSISDSQQHGPSSTTDFATATITINNVVLANSNGSHVNSTTFPYGKYPLNKNVTVKYPLPLEVALSDLSNGEWNFNDSSLKVGQGLPLISDSLYTGYLQISFDYDVKYLLDASQTNKKIYFSIKRDDWLTNKTGYKRGYLSLDDPFGNTMYTEHEFKDYAFESDTGHIDITVPINREESLWFRMSPQDESGGYYAVMSNLKVTQLTS